MVMYALLFNFSLIETGVKFSIGSIEIKILWPLGVIKRNLTSAEV